MFSKTFLRRQTSWWTPKRKNTNISLYFLQWWLKWNIQIQTGMEEATCEKAAFVSTFQDNTEDFTIIQGPAARIRPTRLPDSYFSCESHFITHFSVTTATDNIYSFFFPPLTVDYEGLVKNLSVCEVFLYVSLVLIRKMKNDLPA